jgi:hypothetical protein
MRAASLNDELMRLRLSSGDYDVTGLPIKKSPYL